MRGSACLVPFRASVLPCLGAARSAATSLGCLFPTGGLDPATDEKTRRAPTPSEDDENAAPTAIRHSTWDQLGLHRLRIVVQRRQRFDVHHIRSRARRG